MPLTQRERLRMYLADPLNSDGVDDYSFFKNDEIDDLLVQAEQSLFLAAYLGWAIKAAKYAELVDVMESGSQRNLSQKHRQAILQMKWFFDVAERDTATRDSVGRVAGKVAKILTTGIDKVVVNEYIGEQPTSVRQYPTHRMNPTLG